MGKLVILLICVRFLIWLADCKPKRMNLLGAISSDEDKFSPYKGGRKWTAENTAEKITEYEKAHHKDFLKNKDEYEVWPQLNNEIPEAFCRKYIQKLFQFSTSRFKILPEKWLSINLHYTMIKGVNDHPLEPVNVTAALCYLPKNFRRRYFVYIKAPQLQCVFLVNPLKNNIKSRFENGFYIINKFCEDIDEVIVEDLDTSQNNNYNKDIDCGVEIGKWAVREKIKKKAMKKAKKRIRKWMKEIPFEILAKYEKEHADNYFINEDEYKIWPELSTMDTKSVCQKGIQKLFSGSLFENVYATILWSNELHYLYMAQEHNQDSPQIVDVPILQCHAPNCTKRRYHYYIRTPKPHCLFMVRPLAKYKLTIFKITDKFCEEHELSTENSKLALLAEVSLSNMAKKK